MVIEVRTVSTLGGRVYSLGRGVRNFLEMYLGGGYMGVYVCEELSSCAPVHRKHFCLYVTPQF